MKEKNNFQTVFKGRSRDIIFFWDFKRTQEGTLREGTLREMFVCYFFQNIILWFWLWFFFVGLFLGFGGFFKDLGGLSFNKKDSS